MTTITRFVDKVVTHDLRTTLTALVVVFVSLGSHLSASKQLLPESFTKECQGTDSGMQDTFTSQPYKRIEFYRERYTNCTIVTSNLEIAHLYPQPGSDYDLSFFENIREVHGYVLVASNLVNRVPLTSLRVIRGLVLYEFTSSGSGTEEQEDDIYLSLYVGGNINRAPNGSLQGVRILELPALREIVRGSVLYKKNELLCYGDHDTIDWSYILPDDGRVIHVATNKSGCDAENPCDEACSANFDSSRRLCWGPGPKLCQKITNLTCHEECRGRCFGAGAGQCCHSECVGGCFGAGNKRCWACRHFNYSGSCVNQCPSYLIYHQEEHVWVQNPDVKYSYKATCLDKCPTHMYADRGACVTSCGEGRMNVGGICQECDGPCPRVCRGTTGSSGDYFGFVHSGNIGNFTNCTTIEGGLSFINSTFRGDRWHKIAPMTADKLVAFQNVQVVRDYVSVNAYDANLTSLSFLKNLRTIKGQALSRQRYSLMVHMTSVKLLGLVSLESIENGAVAIVGNAQLCYMGNIPWHDLRHSRNQSIIVRGNKASDNCAAANAICSPQCGEHGCWGPGSDQCVHCPQYRRNDTRVCLQSCDEEPRLYADDSAPQKQCRPCDPQCLNGCTGPGSGACDGCVNAKDGMYCVAKCPPCKFRDNSGVCQWCHPNCGKVVECSGPPRCTGPGAHLGLGGCIECANLLLDHQEGVGYTECLNRTLVDCEKGFYFFGGKIRIPSNASRGFEDRIVLKGCRRCDAQCEECSNHDRFCDICKWFRTDKGECVANCSTVHPPSYLEPLDYAMTEKGHCQPCHVECRQCAGPSHVNCSRCENRKIYVEHLVEHGVSDDELLANYSVTANDTDSFFCAAECPAALDHVIIESHEGYAAQVCSVQPLDERGGSVLLVGILVPVACVLVAFAVVATFFLRRQWTRAETRRLHLTVKLSGLATDEEELSPGNASPDMASLRLCKESELRRGQIIGSGAFGTVYKGVYIPERENVKIVVAIKELSESSNPGSDTELLEEARIMASVMHPCCIRIMAVCVTRQMMLVTPLMPFGSLLDYLHRNRSNIGSRSMLTWAKQIAEGMNYLESRGIVHRDLAARNVLVHGPTQVKITDFGLSKLLECDEESYQATGGKLPIKWLALESIRQRKFTHKSDVWSYGVTLWELFTYGQRPYDEIRAIDIARELDKGTRLPQPTICTIDVYMIMVKCWFVDTGSRPSFAELTAEFSKMAKDPGRYLVIENDALMRLPSMTPDMREMMRSMSIVSDGSDNFVSADEYLQPQIDDQIIGDRRPLQNIAEESYQNAPLLSSTDEVDGGKARTSSSQSPPGSADYTRQQSARYTKEPCADAELWPPEKRPPPVPTSHGAAKANDQRMKTDKDGYLETNFGATCDDDVPPAYLDAVEPVPPGNQYIDMKTPDVDGPSRGFAIANPDYFNQGQQQQHAAATAPTEYLNIGRR